MKKSSLEIKNTIEEWIKITNAKFEDITKEEKAKEPRLEWIFRINKILAVYMMENRSDRINLDVPINFANEHQQATSEMDDKEFLKFLIELMEPLTIAGLTARFQQKEKMILQMTIQTYIDTEAFKRESFFQKWDQIANFKEITIKKIQSRFGVKGMIADSSADSYKPYT